jgi:hypothetical protein
MPQPKISAVAKLLQAVDFSAESIVEAAANNSALFADAAEFRLDCLFKRADAKAAYERIAAETEMRVRRDAAKLDEKLTEAGCSAKVKLDSKVAAAREAYDKADALDEYSKLITDLFRMRRDCLEIVKDMVRSEISAQASIESQRDKLTRYRRDLKEKFPQSED